jgi:hypothetical protein
MNCLRIERNSERSDERCRGLVPVQQLPEHLLEVALTLSSDRCCSVVFTGDCAAYEISPLIENPLVTYPRVAPRRGDFLGSVVARLSERSRAV